MGLRSSKIWDFGPNLWSRAADGFHGLRGPPHESARVRCEAHRGMRAAMAGIAMPANREKRRVLIVDDEEALAWSLSTRLEKIRPRFEVETANDGATALAKLRMQPADLLVADVRMPAMSGIDLALAALQLN